LLYRSLAWSSLPRLFAETVIQFSQVLFCVAGASIFGWLLAFYRVPELVTDFMLGVTTDWRVIMLLIVLLYIILGTFMDAIPAILIFVPILQPIALKVGIHPVHLGVVIVMTLALGLLTLPYGLCALTACAVAGIPVTRILKLLHLMMIAIIIIIIVCALVPDTVLAIPKLLVPKWV
jgi:TRAP-type C4-dicarboxylate transport system permease large subunit